MPVVALCPRCRAALSGVRSGERCHRCGENVVASRRALCGNCGTDVTGALRVKDPAGEYFCPPCWVERYEGSGQAPAYPCALCRQWYAPGDIHTQGTRYVCKSCLAYRDFDPDALLDAAAEASAGEPVAFQPAVVSFSEARRREAQERARWTMLWMGFAGAAVVILLIVVAVVAA